jgi:hypothetical protein
MRPLLALILLLCVSSAHAELQTESLPAGAAGIVGMDLTAFRASKFGQAFEKLAGIKAKQLEASRKLSEQLGLDSKQDLHEIVIAIYPGDDGKVSEKDATGVVLVRGKFLPARINSFGQANGLPSKTAGKYQAWEAGAFIEKLSGEKPKENVKDAYVVAHSDNLVIIASAKFLERAIAAADRRENSALLPRNVAAKFAAARTGWLYLYADATKMKDAKPEVGAESLSLVLDENAADLRLKSSAGFVSEEKASLMRKQLAGLQAMATIGLMNADEKSPEEKENLTLLSELIQKIRLGGEGKTATLELDFPVDKAVQALTKAVEKSQPRPAGK